MLSRSKNGPSTIPDNTSLKEQFASFVADSAFPCLGARAAFNSNSYVAKVYNELAHPICSERLARDLQDFQESEMRRIREFATFAAIFRNPKDTDETEFENLLWSQLCQLHEIDARRHGWDTSVSSDPDDPHFSFSFAGQAIYVVGMHANSSRLSRRFSWPTLVFNPHEQFERLRREGKWSHMQQVIRGRDVALQGNANPMLNEFGETSEARQYSGRAVAEDWRAPFQHDRTSAENAARCPFAPKQ
jgi:FPC/CPF motif-containing protein YcgG